MTRSAVARVDAARGTRVTAGSFTNPMFEFSSESMSSAPGAMSVGRESMLMARVPLEGAYQRASRVRAADAYLDAARADAAATRQRVALDAANAFFRVARAQANARIAREMVSWLDSLVAYNTSRVREGTAAEVDLLRSQTDRDRAYAEEGMQLAESARALAALRIFADVPVNAQVAFDSMFITSAGSDATRTTPVVAAAKARFLAGQAAITQQRTMVVDQLALIAGTKRADGRSSFVVGFELPIPLLNQNRGGLITARAERDAASAELELSERQSTADVEAATASVSLLRERIDRLSDGFLRRADEVRAISLAAYREGSGPLLQVLDASRSWGEAHTTYVETLISLQEAMLQLIAARGYDIENVLTSGVTK